MSKKETIGDLLLDLEVTLDKMIDNHELQLGDIMALVFNHIHVHRKDAIEQYIDNTEPVYYYGHKKYLPKRKN